MLPSLIRSWLDSRRLRLVPAFIAASLLSACAAPLVIGGFAVPTYVSPAIETAHEVKDSANRDALEAKAATGDRVAQYELGEKHCCLVGGPIDRVSVYDNDKATLWYCKAAHQGYVPAQMRLAKLYSGHPGHGFRILQWASSMVGHADADMPLALMWARVAAAQGNPDAAKLLEDIGSHTTLIEREKADALMARWRTAPCKWSEVFAGR